MLWECVRNRPKPWMLLLENQFIRTASKFEIWMSVWKINAILPPNPHLLRFEIMSAKVEYVYFPVHNRIVPLPPFVDVSRRGRLLTIKGVNSTDTAGHTLPFDDGRECRTPHIICSHERKENFKFIGLLNEKANIIISKVSQTWFPYRMPRFKFKPMQFPYFLPLFKTFSNHPELVARISIVLHKWK